MRILKSLIVVIACALSGAAFAQATCLQSLPVKPSKSVTYLNFGSTAGDKISKTLGCPIAEGMRTEMFLSGEALNPDLLGKANQLRGKIADTKTKLASYKGQLQTATNRATRETILKSVKLSLAVAGAASATTACFTSGVACITVVSSVVTLYELVDSMATTGGDLAQQAATARAEIDKILPALQAMETQLNDNLAEQGKLRYNTVFNELCTAIKQQCL
jgi:hypothetical protein